MEGCPGRGILGEAAIEPIPLKVPPGIGGVGGKNVEDKTETRGNVLMGGVN